MKTNFRVPTDILLKIGYLEKFRVDKLLFTSDYDNTITTFKRNNSLVNTYDDIIIFETENGCKYGIIKIGMSKLLTRYYSYIVTKSKNEKDFKQKTDTSKTVLVQDENLSVTVLKNNDQCIIIKVREIEGV